MDAIKILLIDKDEASRNFLAQMIVKKNYQVLHASSGREGAAKAVEEKPDLIIFDTNLDDLLPVEMLSQLQQNPVTAHIPSVVLSSQSTPEEMQTCLEAGCTEYFVKSGMVMMTVVNSIPKLVLEGRKQKHSDGRNGLVVAFLSANGGMGTSSLCANIAMSVAQHVHPSTVAVVDLVLPMGSISQIMGMDDADFNVIKVSEMPTAAMTPEYFQNKLVTPAPWLARLLPGSPDPAMSNHLVVENVPGIFSGLRKAFDFTMVDLGRTLSRVSLPILHWADLIVLVVGTNQSTVHLTKKAWSYLLDQGIDKNRLFPILNRAVGLEGLTKAEAEKFLGFEIKATIPYMMGNFALANNQHTPISVKLPNDTISLVLKQLAYDISKQAIKSH